jgi:hypothetical protein
MRKSLVVMAILALSATSAFADDAAPTAAEATTQVAEAAPAPAPAAAAVQVSEGQTIVAANGARLGRVSRLDNSGSPQLIFQGRLVTVPLATLSAGENGRLNTSLNPDEL